MITQPSLLTLSSFGKLREKILLTNLISSLLHMGRGIFGIDFGSMAFSIVKVPCEKYKGVYFRLHQRTFQFINLEDIEKLFMFSKGDLTARFDFSKYDTNLGVSYEQIHDLQGRRLYYETRQSNFTLIPNYSMAYWATDGMLNAFVNGQKVSDIADVKKGMDTGDNERFLRFWFEVKLNNIKFDSNDSEEFIASNRKWAPLQKGGAFRKWYGNNEYIVNWKNNGADIRATGRATIRSPQYYFKTGISWSTISSTYLGMRKVSNGFVFETAGNMMFFAKEEQIDYALAFLCSKIPPVFMECLNPTITTTVGSVSNLPVLQIPEKSEAIKALVDQCVHMEMEDWDSFEASWNFMEHPFLMAAKREKGTSLIEKSFNEWEEASDNRFRRLKENEEELNKLFIEIYGLDGELSSEVEDKDITIRRADRQRDIRSFISYAVGCMFGRYSIDAPGLVFCGGNWSDVNYKTFLPDKDGILPICDDEYFEDDIVNRFVEFVKTVYGTDTLEENLRFIADVLGGKGSSREVIRNYFINDFYADHLKVYQKRPIYWLFDSGKKNGFKCLIYMHRYQPDTIARIRTDYVHEQQSRYRTAIADLESRVANTGTGERVKLTKRLDSIKAQAEELRVYEEKIHHLADQMIRIDLDDGVKVNYAKFQDVLAKIK